MGSVPQKKYYDFQIIDFLHKQEKVTVYDIQPAPKTAGSGYVFLRKQNTPKLNGLTYQQHSLCSQISTSSRAQRGEQRLGLGHLEATPFAWGEVHTSAGTSDGAGSVGTHGLAMGLLASSWPGDWLPKASILTEREQGGSSSAFYDPTFEVPHHHFAAFC